MRWMGEMDEEKVDEHEFDRPNGFFDKQTLSDRHGNQNGSFRFKRSSGDRAKCDKRWMGIDDATENTHCNQQESNFQFQDGYAALC